MNTAQTTEAHAAARIHQHLQHSQQLPRSPFMLDLSASTLRMRDTFPLFGSVPVFHVRKVNCWEISSGSWLARV